MTKLRANLAQLLSYMSQAPIKHRGALLLYNVTDVPVVVDRRAAPIKGRVYVVPVNLCDKTPSKRKDAIELVESDDPKVLIHFRSPLRRRTRTDGA
jgi:hypothetical protein